MRKLIDIEHDEGVILTKWSELERERKLIVERQKELATLAVENRRKFTIGEVVFPERRPGDRYVVSDVRGNIHQYGDSPPYVTLNYHGHKLKVDGQPGKVLQSLYYSKLLSTGVFYDGKI